MAKKQMDSAPPTEAELQKEARCLLLGSFTDVKTALEEYKGNGPFWWTDFYWVPMSLFESLTVKEIKCLLILIDNDEMRKEKQGVAPRGEQSTSSVFWFPVHALEDVIPPAEQTRVLNSLASKGYIWKEVEAGFGGKRYVAVNYRKLVKEILHRDIR